MAQPHTIGRTRLASGDTLRGPSVVQAPVRIIPNSNRRPNMSHSSVEPGITYQGPPEGIPEELRA